MIVVSNTSPLTNLAAIGQFHLLQRLYGEIRIARGVWLELNRGGRHPGSLEVENASWVRRCDVASEAWLRVLLRDLDQGEAETLVLAMEVQADLVLLDEREARHVAARLGLRPLGVLGLLLQAKSLGLLTAVRPHLDALRESAGFYLGEKLFWQILEEAGEST